MTNRKLNNYISEAKEALFRGWDFSYLKDRFLIEQLSWNFREIIMKYIKKASALLDMGTGGGEFLSSIKGLPKDTYATEGYKPNVKIAQDRLRKIGVKVLENYDDKNLPFMSQKFNLIINRHASYCPEEVKRILKKGGIFITQQVGKYDQIELNKFFNDHSFENKNWNLDNAMEKLMKNRFKIIYKKEELINSRFMDIGAIIYYLKAIPWQISDFNLDGSLEKIKELHEVIENKGSFTAHAHRFILIAERS